MSPQHLLSLACALLGSTALAQNCGFNVHPLHLVDALGVPRPVANGVAHFDREAVHVAFDPSMPSGTYYVHVTDANGPTEVVSTNDPMDRFVTVTNTAGVITLALPYTNNPDPTLFGVGLGGVGQSLRLGSMRNPAVGPCDFAVQVGDLWDLQFGPEWPYLIRGGQVNPATGLCTVASFHFFRIGDGNGSDVVGQVFDDADRDGVRDPGEGARVNWQVRLVNAASSVLTTTDANGAYRFAGVAAGSYTLELALQPGFVATTPGAVAVEVCACADAEVPAFGVAPAILACDGHGVGYWRNKHGIAKVQQFGVLPTLPALHLRSMFGCQVAPGHPATFKLFLQLANSLNMAYMLSAQVLAMHCNVMCGFVDPACVVRDQHFGNVSVAHLMQQAVASLSQHGMTLPFHPARRHQERLKNALDNANNNRRWL